jgi:hypothetical protein
MRPWRGSMPLATKGELPVAKRSAPYILRLIWWFLTQPTTHDHDDELEFAARRDAWLKKRPVRK